MTSTFRQETIGQVFYRDKMQRANPGLIEGMGPYKGEPYLNTVGGAPAIVDIVPPGTVDADQDYVITLDGITITVTTDPTPTDVELGTLIFDAIRADAQISRNYSSALNTGDGTVTLTRRFIGLPSTITQDNAGDTTNDLTITQTQAPALGGEIGFGLFVATKPAYLTDPRTGVMQAALPDNVADTVVGCTLSSFQEKNSVGPNSVPVYAFGQTMNVMQNTKIIEGVWCQTVESDIAKGDTIYAVVGGADAGKVTTTAGGNIDLSALGAKVSDPATPYESGTVALIRFDLT